MDWIHCERNLPDFFIWIYVRNVDTSLYGHLPSATHCGAFLRPYICAGCPTCFMAFSTAALKHDWVPKWMHTLAAFSRLYLEEFRREQILWVVEQSLTRCLSSAVRFGLRLLHGHSFTSWILNIQCRLDSDKKNPFMGCTHMQCRCQSLTVAARQRLTRAFLPHMWYSPNPPCKLSGFSIRHLAE